MSIEIFDHTLLKSVVRQGMDSDRKLVVFSPGELGYTTDTHRLYVGTGSLSGGTVVGNKYLGTFSNISLFPTGEIGDWIENSTDNSIYQIISGVGGTTSSNWHITATLYTNTDGSITVTGGNIKVGTLSASNIHPSLVGSGLQLSTTLQLSSTIAVDTIQGRSGQTLTLPSKLNINGITYTYPSTSLSNDLFLKTDLSGNLSWSIPAAQSVFALSSGPIPVGTIVPFISANCIPSSFLPCSGGYVLTGAYVDLFSKIGYAFGSASGGTQFRIPTLSATGEIIAIKSIADPIFDLTLKVVHPLSSALSSFSIMKGPNTIQLDSIVPKAYVSFKQNAVIMKNYNVASCYLSAVAPDTQGLGISTPITTLASNAYKPTGALSSVSGIYVIKFTNPVDMATDSVEIKAYNYRQSQVNYYMDKSQYGGVPLFDYKFIDNSTLVVFIITYFSTTSTRGAGVYYDFLLDSGAVNDATRFVVTVT